MKKKIIIFLSISLLLIAIYTIIWCLLLFIPARELNKQYAGKNINTNLINNAENYYIKFDKIVPFGFPFKLGFKITGWTEESKVGKIECASPIYIGYDLKEQKLFGRYSGETLAWHKPLQSKFGSKIVTENYELNIKIPLGLKFLKILFSKTSNGFEIINLVETFELSSRKEQIFDMVSLEKLYDQDHKLLKLSFDKRKYYLNAEDFFNNIPLQINIEQQAKINEATFIKRVMPPTILFGLNWPFTISGANKITLKINEPNVKDFIKDLEIYFHMIDSNSSIHHAQAEIIYKGKINNKDADIYFKINSEINIKSGFFDKIFDSFEFLSKLTDNANNNLLAGGSPFQALASGTLKHLNNSAIRELEGHKYLLNLDLNLNNKLRDLKVAVNDFSLTSGNTGVFLRGENRLSLDLDWHIKGKLGFNNQSRIAELLLKKDISGALRNFSLAARELYTDVSSQFLRSISEYPLSTSNDISLQYSFGSKELKKGKLGTVDAENLSVLFDLALYKEAIKRIGVTGYMPNMLKELAPTLSLEKQKILEKLITNPTVVEQDTWNELIK